MATTVFYLDIDCSGQTIVPATFCGVQFSFHPTSEGVKNASLVIPSSVVSQDLTVPLKGKGVTSSGYHFDQTS